MATPNIVPRGNGEGGIGTNEKFWKNGYFENLQTRDGAVATESYVQQKTEEHNSATAVHTANLASKAEAEAGTNTSKFMTPARVSDAIKNFAGADLTGMIFAFAGNSIPSGFLLCDGSKVSRTTYKKLFDVIGTTYGAGDGSTTFNLPNLTDKFIQGSNTVGAVKAAGLPNITASKTVRTASDNVFSNDWEGALGHDFAASDIKWYNAIAYTTDSTKNNSILRFDASKSNSIYGNSTTVQPPAVTMRYIIKY